MHCRSVAVLLALSSAALYAQTPPIKMGLWELSMTMTESDSHTTLKLKSCVTAEKWQEMLSASKMPAGCNINRTQNGNSFTYNGSCSMHNMTMTTKGTATLQDAEHITSESHTTMTMDGKTQEIEGKSESHFLSSDCGSVQPGKPQRE